MQVKIVSIELIHKGGWGGGGVGGWSNIYLEITLLVQEPFTITKKYSERFEPITKDSCHKLVEHNRPGRGSPE